MAESRTAAQIDPYRCRVVAGDWFSPYDGVTTDDPAVLQVDHVVALAEAWDSGAAAWDEDRRRAFANDVDFGGSLTAVSGESNQAKADHDPAGWLPSRVEDHCRFASDWVEVKVRWDLSADDAEIVALDSVLSGCSSP